MSFKRVGRTAIAGLLASAAACSVYDESLLGAGGGAATSATTESTTATATGGGAATTTTATATTGTMAATTGAATTTGSMGTGGGGGCDTAADCPGADTECQVRTCVADVCGFEDTAADTPLAVQTPGDCLEQQCDGAGGVKEVDDDLDLPDDMKECTTDSCQQGAKVFTPRPVHTACSEGGGSFCNAAAACVECTQPGDCPAMVCDASFSCAPAGCDDMVKNGTESDVDCGGLCMPCATGELCLLGSDCLGGLCTGGSCAATCTDTVKNDAETDVDCGGPTCPDCAVGETCAVDADCVSDKCTAGVCAFRLLISEMRTRGAAGAGDEFVELYNPTSSPITLDATWKLESRGSTAANYGSKWTGSGAVIPAHGHYLLAAAGYTQMPAADAALGGGGISDATSIRLLNGGAVIDAVCFHYSAGTQANFTNGVGFSCEGTTVSNLPHNDTNTVASSSDASIERKPGGPAGNGTDTGANDQDFQPLAPANPQSSQSPPTP